jgi:hypothetical protein
MLDDYVHKYKSMIQSYDSRYQQEMSMLELDLTVERIDVSHPRKALIDSIRSYVSHQNDQIDRKVCSKSHFFERDCRVVVDVIIGHHRERHRQVVLSFHKR